MSQFARVALVWRSSNTVGTYLLPSPLLDGPSIARIPYGLVICHKRAVNQFTERLARLRLKSWFAKAENTRLSGIQQLKNLVGGFDGDKRCSVFFRGFGRSSFRWTCGDGS